MNRASAFRHLLVVALLAWLLAWVSAAHAQDHIVERQWFDPWVFELHGEEDAGGDAAWNADEANPSEVLLPWVAGFSLACELFPDLMRQNTADLLEPLAAIFRHIDPDDLDRVVSTVTAAGVSAAGNWLASQAPTAPPSERPKTTMQSAAPPRPCRR